MKIKALRSNFGDYGHIRRGEIIDVLDEHAQQLVKRGVFTDILSSEDRQADAILVDGAVDLEKLKKPELASYAFQHHGITVNNGDTKANIVEAINAARKYAEIAESLFALDEDELRAVAVTESVAIEDDDPKTVIVEKIAKARNEA